jgi:RHS repeat-associated protein
MQRRWLLGLERPPNPVKRDDMTIANRLARRLLQLGATAALLLSAAAVQAQTVVYYHTDALGSVVAVTDASRNVIEENEYEPYGKVVNHALQDGPGYTGHVADAQTGMIYMQQRYYDDDLGGFPTVDPVSADSVGGNFNRYWYANNNPYRFTDPDGRRSKEEHDHKREEAEKEPPPPPDCSAACMRMRNTSDNGQSGSSYSGPGGVFTSQTEARDAASSYITASNGGPILNAIAGDSYLTNVTQINSSPDLFTYSLTPMITGMPPSAMIRGAAVGGVIRGYTRHGLHQAISRDGGRGVSALSMLNAVRSPAVVTAGRGGTMIYRGADGTTVVMNQAGKVITTYGVPRAP